MRHRTEHRTFVVIYLALYFCLLTPMHLLHLGEGYGAPSGFGQACEQSDLHAAHHSGSCPTCQQSNGLIDLPVQTTHVSTLGPISIVSEAGESAVSCHRPSLRSPRAPPRAA